MNRPRRIGMLIAFALIGGLVASCAIGLSIIGRVFDPCEDVIQSEKRSPDGDYIAVVFQRDCGVFASNTQVGLKPSGGWLTRFRKPESVMSWEPPTAIYVDWLDRRTLRIEIPDTNAKFQRLETSWRDVRIVYKRVGFKSGFK